MCSSDLEGNLNSAIDHIYILTNNPDLYTQHGACPYMASDHLLVYSARKKFEVKHTKSHDRARSYKTFNVTEISNAIGSTDWTPVLQADNVDSA